MHDGRMLNLEGVLDHYSGEVLESETLDPLLRQADGRLGIPFTSEEKQALLAFLNTLNDEDFVKNTFLSE